MRMLARGIAPLLLVTACADAEPSNNAVTAAIGEQLAGRVVAPLQRAAIGFDPGLDGLSNALRAALDDIALPDGVRRVVPGTRTSTTADGAYAEISMAIVVYPPTASRCSAWFSPCPAQARLSPNRGREIRSMVAPTPR